jgi:DNA repair exonuclease SbcCD ATPase subunit
LVAVEQKYQIASGEGKFREDMKNFIENVKTALPKAFESEDYVARRETTIRVLENQRKQLIDELSSKAQREGFVIKTTPIGILLIPVLDGKPLSEEEMLALPPKTKDKLNEKREKLETEFRNAMRQLIDMERKIHEALKKLNKEVALARKPVERLMEKHRYSRSYGYLK